MGDTRLLIVAGKGGVGKTTVAAVLAESARRARRRVCLIDVEGRPGLATMFGQPEPLGFEPTELAEGITARSIAADRALGEYLDEHGLARFSKRLSESGTLDVISSGAPGLRDLLILGKVKQIALSDEFDLVIVDSPASGHAVSFLRSPQGLLDAVRGGPVRAQAEDVLGLLRDGERCAAVLVTLPEETPINETLETAAALRDRVGVRLWGVIVNQVAAGEDLEGLRLDAAGLPRAETAALRAAAVYTLARVAAQREQITRLADFAVTRLPTVADVTLDALAGALG